MCIDRSPSTFQLFAFDQPCARLLIHLHARSLPDVIHTSSSAAACVIVYYRVDIIGIQHNSSILRCKHAAATPLRMSCNVWHATTTCNQRRATTTTPRVSSRRYYSSSIHNRALSHFSLFSSLLFSSLLFSSLLFSSVQYIIALSVPFLVMVDDSYSDEAGTTIKIKDNCACTHD